MNLSLSSFHNFYLSHFFFAEVREDCFTTLDVCRQRRPIVEGERDFYFLPLNGDDAAALNGRELNLLSKEEI
jgi:hypothetical protein